MEEQGQDVPPKLRPLFLAFDVQQGLGVVENAVETIGQLAGQFGPHHAQRGAAKAVRLQGKGFRFDGCRRGRWSTGLLLEMCNLRCQGGNRTAFSLFQAGYSAKGQQRRSQGLVEQIEQGAGKHHDQPEGAGDNFVQTEKNPLSMVAQAETELLQAEVDAAQRTDKGHGLPVFSFGLFLNGAELYLEADQVNSGGQGRFESFGNKDIGGEVIDLLIQE